MDRPMIIINMSNEVIPRSRERRSRSAQRFGKALTEEADIKPKPASVGDTSDLEEDCYYDSSSISHARDFEEPDPDGRGSSSDEERDRGLEFSSRKAAGGSESWAADKLNKLLHAWTYLDVPAPADEGAP